jgi:PAS domain S-box-containing protein
MANKTATMMLGCDWEKLADRDLLDFVHPDCRKACSGLFSTGKRPGNLPETVELQVIPSTGGSLPVDVCSDPVVWQGREAVLVTMWNIEGRKRVEQALRDSESTLRALVDLIPYPVYAKDAEGRFLLVNPATARAAGCTVDALLGRKYSEFMSNAEDVERIRQDDLEIINTGRPKFIAEEPVRDTQGVTHVVQTSKLPISFPGQTQPAVLGVLVDITDRKRVEEALRESEHRYRDLVENLNEVVYVISDTGRLTYVNAAVQSIFGYSPEELLGRSVTEAMHPEDIPKFQTALAEVIGGQNRSNEYRFAAKDGSEKWVLTSSYPHYENGRIAGVRGIFSDITERKAMELQLQEREEAFRALAETAGEGIVVVDAQRRVLYSNPKARSMLGVSAEDLPHEDMLDFVVDEEKDDVGIRHCELLGGERLPQRGVQTFIDSHGQSLKVEIISAKMTWYGQGALLIMFHDVTDRLRMEEELRCHQENLERKLAERTEYIRRIEHRQAEFEKLAAVSGLAARIAHEINNPLGGVKNAFLLIKDKISTDAPHAKYVRMVEKEIDRMTRIVRELYTICRPGPEPTGSFGIAGTLREVISLLEAESYSSGIRVEMDVKPPDSAFFGGEDAVRQILFNLSKNAIEASPPGAVVSVQAIVEEDGLHLSVSDQGTGIADDVRPRLFEPFFSTKPSRGTMGLGLGLPVSKSLVEALGGSLDFETRVGEGTIFRVWLPSSSVGAQEG